MPPFGVPTLMQGPRVLGTAAELGGAPPSAHLLLPPLPALVALLFPDARTPLHRGDVAGEAIPSLKRLVRPRGGGRAAARPGSSTGRKGRRSRSPRAPSPPRKEPSCRPRAARVGRGLWDGRRTDASACALRRGHAGSLARGLLAIWGRATAGVGPRGASAAARGWRGCEADDASNAFFSAPRLARRPCDLQPRGPGRCDRRSARAALRGALRPRSTATRPPLTSPRCRRWTTRRRPRRRPRARRSTSCSRRTCRSS